MSSKSESPFSGDVVIDSPALLEQLRNDACSRRAFFTRMGAAGLGLAAIHLLQGCNGGSSSGGLNSGGGGGGSTSSFPVALPGNNDNEKVLNFALTLEFLEADLYRQALNLATGRALDTPLASSPSAYPALTISNGGLGSFETAAGFAYLRDFAFVEAAHAEFLVAALAGKPRVARNPKGYTFGGPVAADLKSILTAILPLEETGVRAYLGAAPFITDYKRTGSIAQVATAIYSTEARHSSAINVLLDKDPGPEFMSGDQKVTPDYPNENTFEYFLSPTVVVSRIQPFIVK